MPSPTIVLVQNDPCIAQQLAKALYAHFRVLTVAENTEVLRRLLLNREAIMAVLDLELVDFEEVRQLVSTYDGLCIVCTHRSPDEQMWIAALNAGAAEHCHPLDIRSILRALRTDSNRQMPSAA